MTAHLRANLWLLVLTVLLCSVLYPLVLWGVGQTVFHDKAQGSLVYDAQGKTVIGSRLIAQPFNDARHFQPRPSAASFDASASGASNLAASNPALRDRVAKWLLAHPEADRDRVPGDMVTTSGSGLDPHITLDNAIWQLDHRIAAAWAAKTGGKVADIRGQIEALLHEKQIQPLGGLVGVPLINVLEVNIELEKRLGQR